METKTPIILPQEISHATGEILGLLPVKWRGMAHIRDGYGEVSTKMISVFDNGDIYIEENSKFIAAQKWLQLAIHKKLKELENK